jgi:hypothetical protein
MSAIFSVVILNFVPATAAQQKNTFSRTCAGGHQNGMVW